MPVVQMSSIQKWIHFRRLYLTAYISLIFRKMLPATAPSIVAEYDWFQHLSGCPQKGLSRRVKCVHCLLRLNQPEEVNEGISHTILAERIGQSGSHDVEAVVCRCSSGIV